MPAPGGVASIGLGISTLDSRYVNVSGDTMTGLLALSGAPTADLHAATKKYVDDLVTAQDLDFAGDSGTGAVDLDSQVFTIGGTANEIETSASDQTITIGIVTSPTLDGTNITGIDISTGTNLGATVPIVLTGDTLSLSFAAPLSLDGSNNLYIAADAIKDTHIDWGTGANQVSAVDVPNDVTNFNGVLSSSDSDVQKALDTVDDDVYTKDEVNELVGGASFDFFLNDTASDIGTYFVMDPTIIGDGESTFTDTITGDAFLIESFATSTLEPTFTKLIIGIYSLHVHAETTVGANVKTVRLYYELYKRTHPGGTETLLVTSEESSVLTDTKSAVGIHGNLTSDTILASTDRFVVKIYANIEDGDPPRNTNPLVTLYAEGDLASRFEVQTIISAFDDRYVQVAGDTMIGALDMGTNNITLDQLGLDDDDNSHHLLLSNINTQSSDLTLSIDTSDASRTLTITGNPTIADWFDQSVKSGSTPTFTGTNITGVPAASILTGTFGTGAYVMDTSLTVPSVLSSSGILTLGGTGGARNENITVDFESSANMVTFSSTTSVATYQFLQNLLMGGDNPSREIQFGGMGQRIWSDEDDVLDYDATILHRWRVDEAQQMSLGDTELNLFDKDIVNVSAIELDIIRADAANGTVVVELDNFAGADFKVGNNNAFVVEGDTDRVGFGTATPGASVEVDGTVLKLNRSGSTFGFQLDFYNSAGREWSIKNSAISGNNGDLSFFNNAISNVLVLAEGGNVGIHNPDPLALLSVGSGTHQTATFSVVAETTGIIANFRDNDGENIFKSTGTVAGASLAVSFGDIDDAANGTKFVVDEGNTKIYADGDALAFGLGTDSPLHLFHMIDNTGVMALDGLNTSGKPMLFIGESNRYGVGFRWNSALALQIVEFDNTAPTTAGGAVIGHFEIRNREFYWLGNVTIGVATGTAKLHVDQTSASGAVPVLRLDQADIDDTFIDFIGTSAADGTRSISSDTTENSAKFGAIQIEINGVPKWIRIYDDHS